MGGGRRLSAIGSSLAIHGALAFAAWAAWLTLRGGHEHHLIWIAAEPAADSVVALGPARAGADVAGAESGAESAAASESKSVAKSGADSGTKPGLGSAAESATKSGAGKKGSAAAGGVGLSIHPRYPRASRALGEEGAVALEIRISPDGRISDVRVVRSSGFRRLDEAAIAAAQAASPPPKSAADSISDSAGTVREITVRFRLNDPPD